MNRATITKYTEMKQIAVNIHKAMLDLNDKCESDTFFLGVSTGCQCRSYWHCIINAGIKRSYFRFSIYKAIRKVLFLGILNQRSYIVKVLF